LVVERSVKGGNEEDGRLVEETLLKKEHTTSLDKGKGRPPVKDQGIAREESGNVGEGTKRVVTAKLEKKKVTNRDKDQLGEKGRNEEEVKSVLPQATNLGKGRTPNQGQDIPTEEGTNLEKKQDQATYLEKKQEVKKEEVSKEEEAEREERISNIPKLDKKETPKGVVGKDKEDDTRRRKEEATTLIEKENFEPLPNLEREGQSGRGVKAETPGLEKGTVDSDKTSLKMEGTKLEEKKSREEILAEREAKKKAKQEARKKKADPKAEVSYHLFIYSVGFKLALNRARI
jgi:hypothetical protein